MSIRFVAEMRPEEAAGVFGVLRPATGGRALRFERSDPLVKARIAEGLLLYGHHRAAAACYVAADSARPGDRELVYPLVVSLAAAGRAGEALARWSEARASGIAPAADTLARRLLTGLPDSEAERARERVVSLLGRVFQDLAAAEPHLELGKELLGAGAARAASIEFSVATGIRPGSADLYWLARGYEAMGARQEALEAYRAALTGGLERPVYRDARDRLLRLMREAGGPGLTLPRGGS